MGFELHAQLANDTLFVGRLGLSQLLLMKDANFPWAILVPERVGVSEVFELSPEDRQRLMHEMSAVAQAMQQAFAADKMNVANLGNMVAQLHVHVIARTKQDLAWPKPVWGAVARSDYTPEALASRLTVMRRIAEQVANGV